MRRVWRVLVFAWTAAGLLAILAGIVVGFLAIRYPPP